MKRLTNIFSASALLLAVGILLFGFTACTSNDTSKVNTAAKSPVISAPAVELKTSMRKLWVEHVGWTRNVILCLVDGTPGTEQAVNRLLQNQVDIGNAIKPYYGEAGGKKLTELLYAHISISTEVVKAAKAEDAIAFDEANKKWYANADQISEFLSKTNPNWALADLKLMMNEHLKLTTDEATQRINKDYDADVLAYDKVHNGILKMSDMIADGITKQFPEKF